jgi:hypothetical protein
MGLRLERQSQSDAVQDGYQSTQFRIAVFAERLVKALAADTRTLGDLRNAVNLSDSAQGEQKTFLVFFRERGGEISRRVARILERLAQGLAVGSSCHDLSPIEPQFKDSFPDRLGVAEIAAAHAVDSGQHTGLRLTVEAVQPLAAMGAQAVRVFAYFRRAF